MTDPTTPRDQIYAALAPAVNAARHLHAAERAGARPPLSSLIAFIDAAQVRAEDAWVTQPGEAVAETGRELMLVAAACVSAMEQYGAPRRGDAGPRLRPATRAEALAAIDGERAYQDRLGPDRTRDPEATHVISQGESLTLLRHYLRRALAHAQNGDPEDALHQIRKLAGISVQMLEKYGIPDAPTPVKENA